MTQSTTVSAQDISTQGSRRQWLTAARALTQSGMLTPPGPLTLGRIINRYWQHGNTAATLFGVAAARYPNRSAIIDDSGAITYAELYRDAGALASHLCAQKRPKSVAIICRNHRGFFQALAATAMTGAETISINTELPAIQLATLLTRHAPDALIYDEEFADAIAAGNFGGTQVVVGGPARTETSVPTLMSIVETSSRFRHRVWRSGKFTLLTSGTTGLAKGVPRSVRLWGVVQLAVSGTATVPLRSRDVVVVGPPFFHGFGLLAAIGVISAGGTVVCRSRFDAATMVDDMARHRATVLFAVPTMLQHILDVEPSAAEKSIHLRCAVTGAAPITSVTVQRFQDRFGNVLVNGYGSTEAGVVTTATPDELRRFPSTVGKAALGVSIRIVDEAGALVPTGNSGRIFVRGPLEYAGYTRDTRSPAPTKVVIDGFVDTGDVGYVNSEGLLFLAGRSDDMIVSGGENVFPGEVEDILVRYPSIKDAIVVGVSDERFGQVLQAFVVTTNNEMVDPDALKLHLRASLERYKIPKQFITIDAIPRNPSGKVLRSKLLELAASGENA
ncbi:putative fatty-acid--CoA ligase [Gordonia effusa NBRC 100432]|uniref:Putative fatty-acid--CoA ligase n=1 Tax=Gordonia effusa NBRC 100432 TaxID=1077974 RepID=H0QUP1_9ACTN|nr:AMP-binding protein [Gordonia effusa]GAB16542.1 putative fatty-acid--CoA ligase [Gordonia effusa NBRC 100432]